MTNMKKNTLTRVVPTRLTNYDYDTFVATAKQHKMSTTALLRQLILEYIDKQKTKIPVLN
ncbi:hypothetical protein NIES2100_59760 [Calothrix sp. NIES-2100]|uniref:hypothetical protein n=1 Tax=Nostocales TaxID=1161 RepID=UPI000B5DEABC|nr:hypothetical protein [Tolypothrix sp. FACHB-123]BAY26163.1 hypothetical protein NIES2100_59760 [Calothrix sp. NIES-2100]